MSPAPPLGIADVRLSTLRGNASEISDLPTGESTTERYSDLHEPTSLGKRLGTVGRFAARGAGQLTVVSGVDDRQSRSDFGGCPRASLRNMVADPLSPWAEATVCAVPRRKPVNHCGQSLRTERAEARLRGRDSARRRRCRRTVRLAACAW